MNGNMEQIEIRRTEGSRKSTTILQIEGPLTLATLFDLQSALRQPGSSDIIVDLTDVPYIDSAGLGALLSQWAHAQRNGTKFALAGMCERVVTLLKITKVETIMPAFPTAGEAEATF
jgi:anti-sigma B factor antagonist